MKQLLVALCIAMMPLTTVAQQRMADGHGSAFERFWVWDARIQQVRDECNNYLWKDPTYRLLVDSFVDPTDPTFERKISLDSLPIMLEQWIDSARYGLKALFRDYIHTYASSPVDSISTKDSYGVSEAVYQFGHDINTAREALAQMDSARKSQ